MAIPTFTYDDELKALYCEDGEVIVAVKGDSNTRAVRFEIPTDVDGSNDGHNTGDLSRNCRYYLVWKNAHGDTGRVKATESEAANNRFSINDGVLTATYQLPNAFTAYPGDAWITLDAIDSLGRSIRFAPVKVKVTEFIESENALALKTDDVPAALRADAGIDSEIYFDQVEKRLVASKGLINAFVKGDDNGRAIDIILPTDLGGYGWVSTSDTIVIQYKNAKGETGEWMVPANRRDFYDRESWSLSEGMQKGSDICLIEFHCPASLTAYPGEAEIQVKVTHPDGSIVNLSPVKIRIGEFFDRSEITPEDPKYDVVHQLETSVSRLEGLITDDNTITLDGYLTKNEASGMYETMESASDTYLSKSDASRTYLTQSDAQKQYGNGRKGYSLNTNSIGTFFMSGSIYDHSRVLWIINEMSGGSIDFTIRGTNHSSLECLVDETISVNLGEGNTKGGLRPLRGVEFERVYGAVGPRYLIVRVFDGQNAPIPQFIELDEEIETIEISTTCPYAFRWYEG